MDACMSQSRFWRRVPSANTSGFSTATTGPPCCDSSTAVTPCGLIVWNARSFGLSTPTREPVSRPGSLCERAAALAGPRRSIEQASPLAVDAGAPWLPAPLLLENKGLRGSGSEVQAYRPAVRMPQDATEKGGATLCTDSFSYGAKLMNLRDLRSVRSAPHLTGAERGTALRHRMKLTWLAADHPKARNARREARGRESALVAR